MARTLPWLLFGRRPVTPEPLPSFADVIRYGSKAFPSSDDDDFVFESNVDDDSSDSDPGIEEPVEEEEVTAEQATVGPVPLPAPTPQRPLVYFLIS